MRKKRKLGVCGHFGSHENINGQMVKTKILTEELTRYFGSNEIALVDTYGWKKHPVLLLFRCVKLSIMCRNILIMPAGGGIKVLAPLFALLCSILKRKLHFSTIGGWLPAYLSDNPWMIKYLKMMSAVYVETKSIKKSLEEFGIKNAVYMPNFKNIAVADVSALPDSFSEPYPLCSFSRVKREKGILDAVEGVRKSNSQAGRNVFSLDIYGSIDDNFREDFEKAVADNSGYVKYMGVADYSKTTDILKNYFALLFPTYYSGEGFPGTIIDAFSSGLPVIATDWLYNSEIVSDGRTGIIYKINESDRSKELARVLDDISSDPQRVISMKKECLREAKKYDSSLVMREMTERME